MSYRKKVGIFTFLSCSGIALSMLMTYAIKELKFCNLFYPAPECGTYFDIIFWFIFLPSVFTLPPLFILLFTKEAVYHTWKKFALPGVIFLAWFALPKGNIGSSNFPSSSIFGFEDVLYFMGGFFLFISLLIIIIRSWQLADNLFGFLEGGKPLIVKPYDEFADKKTPIKLSDTSVIVTAITEAESTQSKKEITETLLSQGFKKKDIEKAFKEIQESKKRK